MNQRFGVAMAGVFLFAAACNGGGGSSGPTGTAGGAPTGGTSGGATTTGGSSTGAPLDGGTPCTTDAACASGVCGVNGSGNCCNARCLTDNATCGATACDDTGACVYPASATSCGADYCAAGNRLTQRACDGAGVCGAGSFTVCDRNFGCDDAGVACNTACATSKDCFSGYVCNAKACVAPTVVGACTEDDDCFSNLCGLNGSGHCCVGATRCVSGDAVCGATDCNAGTGSCNYADAGTACASVAASCTNGTQQNPSVCDGKGTCPAPVTVQCTPFICGATACLNSCTDDTSCATGDFCDISHSSCCPSLPSGGTVTVDATGGSDAADCCGVAGHQPCQTITQVMKTIDSAGAKNVTINAAVRKGHTWNPAGEVYPIVLGWGVKLSAPGVYFYDANKNAEIFDIKSFSANDAVGYASIVGSAILPVTIGVDEFREQANDKSDIQVESGSTLYLANANLNSSDSAQNTAITVAGGGGLVVARDQSNTVLGTVTIGNALNTSTTNGFRGIVCQTANGTGCTIRDAALKPGKSSLVIEGQMYVDIDAEDYADITLSSAPVIGLPPADAGFMQCFTSSGTGTSTQKPDGQASSNGAAVLLNGPASVTFDNGTVQCISGDAFLLNATANGTPTLTLVNTTIQNTEFGVKANAGNVTISNSTIQYNANGVEQGTDGTNLSSVDLSSGGDGGTTTVVCSNSYESIHGRSAPGVSVQNNTTNTLNARNVDWDTSGPDLFMCNSALTICNCESSSCNVDVYDGGFDGLDAVYTSTGLVDTDGGGTSSLDCTAPARNVGGTGCNPPCPQPEICCGQNECCL